MPQHYKTPYYSKSEPHNYNAPTSKASLPTRSHATTRYKGKEIAKPITPPSESASEEDSDPEQAQKDKDMQKRKIRHSLQRVFKKTLQNTKQQPQIFLNTRKHECGYSPRNAEESKKGFKRLHDPDEEIDEQELEAHYSYMAKIQEVPNADSGTDSEPLEQTEFERYKAFNDRTVDYDKLEHKLNEALGLLAQKEIDIKEGLKVKAYEISVVKEKHDEFT
ncbi:hypothetical protein Tco_1577235 [Tanacetum coccineum]